MKNILKASCPLLLMSLLALNQMSCSSVDGGEGLTETATDSFNDYWYSGKAEITRYDLHQARYGEVRKGDAVLVFVTEDFLKDKQVKFEYGESKEIASILKLNFTKKFYTGIYPYSIMTSIFTPVDVQNESTMKISSSAQEWCGQTFMQVNRRGDKLHVFLRSYFQREGDQNFELEPAFLEDELWTRIRLAPETLPTGAIDIIPGLQYLRLGHVAAQKMKANATLEKAPDGQALDEALQVYSLDYEKLKRKLAITFEADFPHRILSWKESHPSGFGRNAKILTTTAVMTHSTRTDYWSKNKLSDNHLRDELGIIY